MIWMDIQVGAASTLHLAEEEIRCWIWLADSFGLVRRGEVSLWEQKRVEMTLASTRTRRAGVKYQLTREVDAGITSEDGRTR